MYCVRSHVQGIVFGVKSGDGVVDVDESGAVVFDLDGDCVG